MPNVPGGPALFKLESKPVPRSETWGTLTALDLTNGGRVLWQIKTPEPLVGGTLATAGGIFFPGGGEWRPPAFDTAPPQTPLALQTGARGWGPPPSPFPDRPPILPPPPRPPPAC